MRRVKWAIVLAASIGVLVVVIGGCDRGRAPARHEPPAPAGLGQETRALRVAVTDDTDGPVGGLDQVEVWVRGHGSWYPDMRHGGDVRVLGEFGVDQTYCSDFYVYPDGRDGTEIRLAFTMTEDMVSGSDRDMVRVEIHEDTVLVWGPPIANRGEEFGQEFKR